MAGPRALSRTPTFDVHAVWRTGGRARVTGTDGGGGTQTVHVKPTISPPDSATSRAGRICRLPYFTAIAPLVATSLRRTRSGRRDITYARDRLSASAIRRWGIAFGADSSTGWIVAHARAPMLGPIVGARTATRSGANLAHRYGALIRRVKPVSAESHYPTLRLHAAMSRPFAPRTDQAGLPWSDARAGAVSRPRHAGGVPPARRGRSLSDPPRVGSDRRRRHRTPKKPSSWAVSHGLPRG